MPAETNCSRHPCQTSREVVFCSCFIVGLQAAKLIGLQAYGHQWIIPKLTVTAPQIAAAVSLRFQGELFTEEETQIVQPLIINLAPVAA